MSRLDMKARSGAEGVRDCERDLAALCERVAQLESTHRFDTGLKTAMLLAAIFFLGCSPPAWQTRCERYGCDYAEYGYCTGTIACVAWSHDGACVKFEPCTERYDDFAGACTQYRGVSRADLARHHNAGARAE